MWIELCCDDKGSGCMVDMSEFAFVDRRNEEIKTYTIVQPKHWWQFPKTESIATGKFKYLLVLHPVIERPVLIEYTSAEERNKDYQALRTLLCSGMV